MTRRARVRTAGGRSRRRGERGQGLVEFAMVVPVFMLLLLGMLEFGTAFNHQLTIGYATREGARIGADLVNGGSPLGCNTGQSPNAALVDPVIIEAVDRVLTSGGAPSAREGLPRLAELAVPLIVSVMATSTEQFAELVAAIAARAEVAAIELNVSCPNVHSGLIVGEQPSETEALLGALRPLTEKPLIVKLTPNVAAPALIAAAAEAGGADAVALINTLRARPLLAGRPWLGAGSGGLSGPAVRTIALQQVSDVAAAVALPVVGMGGVERGSHARDLLACGASLVAVGTASFRDPLAAERVLAELLADA